MKVIENQIFDMERALYGSDGVLAKNCFLTARRMERAHLKKERILKHNTVFLICVIRSGMIMGLPLRAVR